MKLCSKCNNLLDFKCFYKNAQSFDGLRPSCIECDKKVRQLWRNNNRKKIKEKTTEYRKNNLDYYSKKTVIYNKKRRQTNDVFKFEHNYRGLIAIAIRRNSFKSKATKLLGCSIEFYKEFLEKQFRDGMTWENKGKLWDIDHIKPLKNFDCSNYDQAKEAFHYLNTQVLLKNEHKLKTFCGK